MQTFHYTELSIHQYIERALRHRLALIVVLTFMSVAILRFDTSFTKVVQQAYGQGFGWIGTYMRHEHPAHGHLEVAINRIPTTSGMG